MRSQVAIYLMDFSKRMAHLLAGDEPVEHISSTRRRQAFSTHIRDTLFFLDDVLAGYGDVLARLG